MSSYSEYTIRQEAKHMGKLLPPIQGNRLFQQDAVCESRRYRVLFSVRHRTRIVPVVHTWIDTLEFQNLFQFEKSLNQEMVC
jgi:hypothetical protein